MSDEERLSLISTTASSNQRFPGNILVAVEARQDGQVIMRLKEPLGPSERGTLLLDLEAFLKETVDPGLVVWLEPLGDRSSLRNLRGVEVKS